MLTVKRCVIGVVWAVLVVVGVGLVSQQPAEAIRCARTAVPFWFVNSSLSHPGLQGMPKPWKPFGTATFCVILGPGF